MRRALLAVAAGVLALPLASCSKGGGDDDAYVLRLDGTAEVTGKGGIEELDEGEHRLAVGDVVEITRGTAVLGLPGDGTLELRSRDRRNSTVEVAATPRLVHGDALLDAGDGRAHLVAGGADLSVDEGVARVRRSTGVTLAVYEGDAEVEAAGRSVAVPAFRQVTISDAGQVPRRPHPLVFDRRRPDPWDQRLLGEAIDLGEQLDRRSLAVDRQLATTPVTTTSLTTLVPRLQEVDGFDEDLLTARRSLGESVVGASIALGGAGSFERRWQAAFSFREDGADWGLVALDQRARRQSLIDVLDAVLRGVPTPFAVVLGGGADLVASPGPNGGGGAAGGGAGEGEDPPPTTSEPPAVPSVPEPTPPPTTPFLPPLTIPPIFGQPSEPAPQSPPDLIGDLGRVLDGLLGGDLGGAVDGTTEAVLGTTGDAVDTVGGLLGAALGPTAG